MSKRDSLIRWRLIREDHPQLQQKITMDNRDKLAGWREVQQNQLRTGPHRLQDTVVPDQTFLDLLTLQDTTNGQGLLLNKYGDDVDEEAMDTFVIVTEQWAEARAKKHK